MLVTSREIFMQSRKKHYAVPAANFVDLDSMKWHLEVAERERRPIILAFAECHVDKLITLEEAAYMGRYYAEHTDIPVVLHLDHGETPELVRKAIDLGFSSVMLDASREDFNVNVQRTKAIVSYASSKGVVVEAEIGHVGAGQNFEGHAEDNSIYTTVEEAEHFIRATQVDSLAVSIGTAHGTYTGVPRIHFERLSEIAAAVDTPLVLHGGSSTGDKNLNRCAKGGISKINIFSDFLLAVKNGMEEENPTEYFAVKEVFKNSMQNCLHHYYQVFATEAI